MSDQDIVDMYKRGIRTAEIAAACGSSAHVYRVLKRHGVSLRRGGWECRVDDATKNRAQRMYDMRASGATLESIARVFGVSRQRVGQILGAGS